ncbi:MAG: major capsid protein [Pyrinomonadaceae bacterium]|nr:major capsid protein [Pyrinomonadaceae bacterium]
MPDFIYPTNEELKTIEQTKIHALSMNDPIFEHFPIVDVDSHVLSWEQRDNYKGLQQVRGLNGQPKRVNAVGGKKFTIEPGVYGEFATIDEIELTTRRQWGSFNQPVNIDDLVTEKQDQLLARRIDRIKAVLWTLVTLGVFTVLNELGQTVYGGTFPVQSFTAGVAWGTSATATPLANFRAVQLLSRGYSVDFGTRAKAYMNRVTFNKLVQNLNANDLAGRRTSGLNSVLNLTEINAILAGEGLPMIVVYDEGYLNDAGTFVPFIADDKVIVIGARPANQPVGDYAMTRNANNPNMEAGAYMKVVDDEDDVPRLITVHDGHNGGPRIYFPSAIVRMSV